MKMIFRWMVRLVVLLIAAWIGLGKDRCLSIAEACVLEATSARLAGSVEADIAAVPAAEWALVPGTSIKGDALRQRCATAAALFHTGKVKRLLLSGDGRSRSYDEPTAMRKQLLALGLPESALMLDRAGLSTYDSMLHAAATAPKAKWVVVTQTLFAPRAVLLGKGAGLDLTAVTTEAESQGSTPLTKREARATVRAILDLLGARNITQHWERQGGIVIAGALVAKL